MARQSVSDLWHRIEREGHKEFIGTVPVSLIFSFDPFEDVTEETDDVPDERGREQEPTAADRPEASVLYPIGKKGDAMPDEGMPGGRSDH